MIIITVIGLVTHVTVTVTSSHNIKKDIEDFKTNNIINY